VFTSGNLWLGNVLSRRTHRATPALRL